MTRPARCPGKSPRRSRPRWTATLEAVSRPTRRNSDRVAGILGRSASRCLRRGVAVRRRLRRIRCSPEVVRASTPTTCASRILQLHPQPPRSTTYSSRRPAARSRAQRRGRTDCWRGRRDRLKLTERPFASWRDARWCARPSAGERAADILPADAAGRGTRAAEGETRCRGFRRTHSSRSRSLPFIQGASSPR